MAIKNPKTEYSKREKFINPDECYTPEYAIKPLLPYLKKDLVIWDCAFGSGRLAEHFRKHGFKVIGNKSIDFLKEGQDCKEFGEMDIIITNPPYSIKDKFLEKAFSLGFPFAFLLPLDAIGSQTRVKMYMKYGIQLIIPNRRINFEIPSRKKASWFHTAWFCGNMNLLNDLNFVELEDKTAQ